MSNTYCGSKFDFRIALLVSYQCCRLMLFQLLLKARRKRQLMMQAILQYNRSLAIFEEESYAVVSNMILLNLVPPGRDISAITTLHTLNKQ